MKNLDDLLRWRRSIRQFRPDTAVAEEEIREMIGAATEAPTWKNSQTGRYYVALGAEARKRVVASLPEFNQRSVAGCGAFVVTTFKHNRSGYERTGEPSNELGNGWGCYDLGLQNAFLLLKAAELGVDTLVVGIRDAAQLRDALAIPDDETVVSVIALGHRADDPARPKRKEVDEIAHFC
ncbi:MAG: nitroreductase family protein [Bacteroidales bacterium]|nr:nitroreductase family protein [Bacteroidales bacterium]